VLALTTDGTVPPDLDLHGFTALALPVDGVGATVEID
jgi:homoserine kinase